MADERTTPIPMRNGPEWLSIVDDWRLQQPGLPERAEAIRQLIDKGLRLPQHGKESA